MPSVFEYRIHPAIGVARLGNSDDWFDGPDVVQEDWVPPEKPAASGHRYRDAVGNLRRQAALFRVYEFEFPNAAEVAKKEGKPVHVREITMNDAKIAWKVKLANRKALDSGGVVSPIIAPDVTLDTKGAALADIIGPFTPAGVSVLLGQVSTDSVGRLRVLAGKGKSHGIAEPTPPADLPDPSTLANLMKYPGWYDDIADGPITATVDFTGFAPPPGVAGPQKAASAWVVTAAPDFAHAVECVVSLYDLAYAIAVGPAFRMPHPTTPSFVKDIYPFLHKAQMAHWTSALLQVFYGTPPTPGTTSTHHFEEPSFGDAAFRAPGAARFNLLKSANKAPSSPELAARRTVHGKLRNPFPGGSGGTMPRLALDASSPANELAVHRFHYKQLKKWAEGDFLADWPPPSPPKTLADLKPEQQPGALDEAHMRSMIGGAFYPGIEVCENVRYWSNWSGPFRIKDTLPAGTLTETLAVPWQGDFEDCANQPPEWWPSARPLKILPGSATTYSGFVDWAPFSDPMLMKMVKRWNELGFLRRQDVPGVGTLYVQREPDVPPSP